MELPQEFEAQARLWLGETRYGRLAVALQEEPSVSIRLNPFKSERAGLAAGALEGGDGPVAWAPDEGCYLKSRPMFTADPLFHAGAYYVQEASSMFLGAVMQRHVTSPVVALDLCAAPGGKSTHIRALLPEGSLLVSNEPVRARAQVLVENMVKWGHPDVVVSNSYPADFGRLPGFFDVMVTDVPCSGEGMFRKEEEAVSGWSMANVVMCRDRQRDILRTAWPALKPGGLLVYSTCTFNPLEDEENVAWIAAELGAEVLPLDVPAEWHVEGDLRGGEEALSVYHLLPGFVRGEGFFLTVLRKSLSDEGGLTDAEVAQAVRLKKVKHKFPASASVPFDVCHSWFKSEGFEFQAEGQRLTAFRTAFSRQKALLCRAVNVMYAGIAVAELKGRDWMPLHALAMSSELDVSAFPAVDVDYDVAVAYLRKESLALPSATPRGYVLLTYSGLPLGFVKNVGGRANNLYPQEWKIRTSHLTPYSLKPDFSF